MKCEEEILGLKVRMTALEQVTFSGVPNLTIEDRFGAVNLRIDQVSDNLRNHITAQIATVHTRIDGLETSMNERFEKIDQRFEAMDRRFEKIDQRFEKIDQRFEKIDGDIMEIKTMLIALGAKAPSVN